MSWRRRSGRFDAFPSPDQKPCTLGIESVQSVRRRTTLSLGDAHHDEVFRRSCLCLIRVPEFHRRVPRDGRHEWRVSFG